MTSIEQLGEAGPTALPRANGELVFQAPWESRAFGMAAALADQQLFDWSDFQASLIASIAAWEQERPAEPYDYYERWLAALESLLASRALVAPDDLDRRIDELLRRPAGHDHHDADGGHAHAGLDDHPGDHDDHRALG